MADPLTHLKQRAGDDWLIGYDSQMFFDLTEYLLEVLRSRPNHETSPTILLAERDPLKFLAHFIAACTANCRIFLANPDWVETEWEQVFELVQPDLIWGEAAIGRWKTAETQRRREETEGRSNSTPLTPHPSLLTPHVLIPTGGTSGKTRFVVHTWSTLMASVEGFRQYFEVDRVNSFCVLPLHHVSGLMQFMRSFTSGGRLVVLPLKAVEMGDRSAVKPEAFFLSLVPTQLQRLLDEEGVEGQTAETQRRRDSFTPNSKLFGETLFPTPVRLSAHVEAHTPHRSAERSRRSPTPHTPHPWLSRFHTVLLGGAPAWSELLDRARSHRIRLAPTYGMTETASQIATLKPDDFLNGHTNVGQVLPHTQITIRSPSGEALAPHQIGNVTIQAKSLAIGYYPPHPTPHTRSAERSRRSPHPTPFSTDDLGFFDAQGYLHIVGRQSDKIITGGENVFPAEVEAAIRATGLVQDVCVIGVSDRHWGQAIAAIYVPINANTPITAIQTALEDKLSRFKRPKHWVAVDQLPRSAQGKVNRSYVEAIAKASLSVATID